MYSLRDAQATCASLLSFFLSSAVSLHPASLFNKRETETPVSALPLCAFTHCRRDTRGRRRANIAIGEIPSTLVCNDIDSMFASGRSSPSVRTRVFARDSDMRAEFLRLDESTVRESVTRDARGEPR
jgi:hypothetical protein